HATTHILEHAQTDSEHYVRHSSCNHTCRAATLYFFFFNHPATPEIYTLSLHDALPICLRYLSRNAPSCKDSAAGSRQHRLVARGDRKSTRLNSSHVAISYAVFCLKKKKYESS